MPKEPEKELDSSEQDFDISQHLYVPKHEIVPENQVDEIFKKYNTTLEKLPRILVSDPVIKSIKANPGDIIKITRKSDTAGTTVYYRYVVEV